MHNPFDPGYYYSEELRTFGFARVGENVRIAKNCLIIRPENIEIDDNSRIDAFCKIIASSGHLRIGQHVHIACTVLLAARGGIDIEDFAGVSDGSRVYSVNDDYSGNTLTGPTIPEEFTNIAKAPVRIGKHCVLGAGTTLFPGANMGEGSVTGAHTLVVRPLAEWGIYVGCPARRIADRSNRLLSLETAFKASKAGVPDIS